MDDRRDRRCCYRVCCGLCRERDGSAYAAMYNDDHDTGGSFCVPVIHDALDVVAALDELRARFAAVK